mmetsp:Transcript_7246/g.21373  ORF Transcript_7246/g.21373 Transcript_7246/m.21373 type:complete len:218 (-) Transcript_7246:640-1293(-)
MDGLLYKKASGKHEHRTVPPMEARLQIVEEFHQIGHAAPDRLRKLISRQYYWNNIGGDCVNVCTNCVGCQLISKEEIIPKAMRPIPVHGVLHRWHLDLIGPMKTTAAGNIYGVVAIDSTSKWVEAGGLPNKTASHLKEWFWENIACRYGTPEEVVTDNGTKFKGYFAALLQKCDITHRHAAAHHPQANGLVERMNRTIRQSKVANTPLKQTGTSSCP